MRLQERSHRGLVRRVANSLYGLNRIEGSNPSLSAKVFVDFVLQTKHGFWRCQEPCHIAYLSDLIPSGHRTPAINWEFMVRCSINRYIADIASRTELLIKGSRDLYVLHMAVLEEFPIPTRTTIISRGFKEMAHRSVVR